MDTHTEAELCGRGFECIDLQKAIKSNQLLTKQDVLDWLDSRIHSIELKLYVEDSK